MKQPTPIVAVALGFVCGIALQTFQPAILYSYAMLALAGGLIYWERFSWRNTALLGLVAGLIGLTYAQWHSAMLPEVLPDSLHGESMTLQGVVGGFPYRNKEGDWCFYLTDPHFDGRFLVTLESDSTLSWPVPGDEMTLHGTCYTQSGRMNFGDPDWEVISRRRHIIARFYADQVITKVNHPIQGPFRPIWLLRRTLYQALYQHLPGGSPRLGRDEASFLFGLTVGVGDELPEEWESSFQKAGLLHLLAVSGGNVAFFLLGLLCILRRFPFSREGEMVLLLVGIAFFVLLTGLESSVIRAGTMASFAVIAKFRWRKTHWPSLLAATVLCILAFQPFMLFEVGFQLSFLAVWGLFVWATPFIQYFQQHWSWPSWLAVAMGSTLAAQWAVLPLSLRLFHQVSLIAPISNLVFAGLILPSSLLLVFLLTIYPFGLYFSWFYGLTDLYLQLLLKSGSFFANLPFAVFSLPTPPWWFVVLLYGMQLFLRYAKGEWRRVSQKSAVALLSVCLLCYWHPWPYPLEVTFIDVGQGDSIFLRFPNGQTMLVDGGGSMTADSNIGLTAVLPYLQRQGIQSIDYAILTHAHGDHYQGLMQVQSEIPFRYFLHALPQTEDVPQDLARWYSGFTQESLISLQEGQVFYPDKQVRIEVQSARFSQDGNNNDSICLHISFGRTDLWLTGDMELPAEEAMNLPVQSTDFYTLLKVAHHGGKTSSGESFLRAVDPEIAVISVGRKNRYGHPSPEVLQRLKQRSCEIYTTSEVGAVRCISNGQQWQIQCCRTGHTN